MQWSCREKFVSGVLLSVVCALSGSARGLVAGEPNGASAEAKTAVSFPLRTPSPGPAPQINGPAVYGCRPDRPFLYRIPCTGERPIAFAARNLPDTLRLDPDSGIVSGQSPSQQGRFTVTFQARNDHGAKERDFTIVVGDTLALTPPMGWNSWYIHYYRVTGADMRAAADAMVNSGMADFGYSYVNIDDCWMVEPGSQDPRRGGAPREPGGAIRSNAEFGDMRALTDYIHAKGLKAGLYTSPGPLTCQKYTGSYQHEQLDAQQFAAWGFDFLKYDWCSYGRVATGEGLPRLQQPYRQMGQILQGLDRDIVFNLCQYGMGEVWKWGGEVGGHCWRTTGDLGLQRSQRLPGFYQIGLSNAKHYEHARPGQWNDPDYILIGWVGDAHQQAEGRPTSLTADEQYSYMSLWCLMAAPLVFSGDMTQLDPFTLNVLCNAEVIAVDQDPLGRQAKPIAQDEQTLILAKPMQDGSWAVGLFNLSEEQRQLSVVFADLGLQRPQRVRDLWRQIDLETLPQEYRATVPPHGVALVRLAPVN